MSKKLARTRLAGIHIREIEKTLFSYLFINKVATSVQIARDVYANKSHQALYKRLNLLIAKGYIEAHYYKELRGRLVYNLSKKGFQEFINGGSGNLREQIKSNSILHDLDLADIRQRLKRFSSVQSYVTENVLRSGAEYLGDEVLEPFRQGHFDGALRIKGKNSSYWFALEYERSVKFSARYRDYFKKIYANPDILGVFFICGDDKVLKAVQPIEEQISANLQSKVFYALLKDVLSAQSSVTFLNLKKEKITLT